MTIGEGIISTSAFPINTTIVEKICIDRGLTVDADYTQVIGASQAFELALADTYDYLAGQPSIVEQEIGVNQLSEVIKNYRRKANEIYSKYDDPKFNGKRYGFIGENWNA